MKIVVFCRLLYRKYIIVGIQVLFLFVKNLFLFLWETIVYLFETLKFLSRWLVTFLRNFVVSFFYFLNIIPNFIWHKDLNLYQNIIYNLYVPNSLGKPSMHTSLVLWAVILSTITLLLELRRFYLDSSYSLSTGFYGILGGLITGVIISFTNFEIQKLKNKNGSNGGHQSDIDGEKNVGVSDISHKDKVIDYDDPGHPTVNSDVNIGRRRRVK
ncbi:MAG: hypothetical protein ABIK31_05415 [candidate division WOR-3 bacterium]